MWLAAAPRPAQFTPTQEITSNNFFSPVGRGDTLCVITDGGINMTFATSDSLTWFGYKSTAFSGAVCMGEGALAATLKGQSKNVTQSNAIINDPLWVYRFPALKTSLSDAQNFMVIDSIFYRDPGLGKLQHDADFSIVDLACTKGAFWLACSDGGLVRLDIATSVLKDILPGNTSSFSPSKIAESSGISLTEFPDTTRRVIALAVEDSSQATPAVWVVTPKKLWRFSYVDTLWDSAAPVPADSTLSLVQYQAAYAAKSSDTLRLYASITVQNRSGASAGPLDTSFFKYDFAKKTWSKRLDNAPSSLAFGQSGQLYLNVKNFISLYRETSGGDSLVIGGGQTFDKFQARMTKATGGNYPDNVNGILYAPQPGGLAQLWIASSANVLPSVNNGLFFSLDEQLGEQNGIAFNYVHSDKKLNTGLKQTYAYPSILNSVNYAKAVFAYSLSKASKVTIRIYDWNMDLVRTVVSNKDRPAGNDQANGRSTNAAEDMWDGTTDSGRRVAVGVYYYKITAQSGEVSFGKIIVAK
jgi:hypothetical protein